MDMSVEQMDFWGSVEQPRARQEWVSACQFHGLNDFQVLQEVLRRVSEKERSVVLLDLDSTLYEVGPRTFQIMKEWASHPESADFPDVCQVIEKMNELHVGYSIADTFAALQLDRQTPSVNQALSHAKRFWLNRFFTSKYLSFDRAYPGASEFAWELHRRGAELVYLTGRDEPNMGEGTRKNLTRDGFPWEVERTHLLMKPAFEVNDLEYKRSAAQFIREKGTLVASFENEPLNLVALHELFPDAMHIFVDTVCSQHSANPRQGLYRVSGFAV